MGQGEQKLLGIRTRPVSRRRLFQPAQAAVPHRWAEQGHEPMPVAEAEKRAMFAALNSAPLQWTS